MTKDCKEVFTDIYARKVWGDGSGGGSVPDTARPYIDFVGKILASGTYLKVLDIGCGDMLIGQYFMGFCEYVGIDAAQPPRLGKFYSSMDSIWQTLQLDALTDELPAADLLLCKEVLQHLSNEQVQTLLDRTAHYPRRLFTNTNHPSLPVNTDIETGDCRAIDLTLQPFNQPTKTVFTYGHWIVQEL